jgi:hypothetical protein
MTTGLNRTAQQAGAKSSTSSLVSITDAARAEIHELVAVLLDAREKRRNTNMRPVAPKEGCRMAHDIRLGDGAVDVCGSKKS